jgi:putative transcriptional regulator
MGYIRFIVYIGVVSMGMVKIKLDTYLKSIGMTRYELSKRTKIKFQTIDNYYKNKVSRYDSHILAQICACLDCDIGDILEYIPN